MTRRLAALLICCAVPAWAAPDAQRQAELTHLVRQDCGSCHGMTLKGGLGSPLLPGALQALPDEALEQTILDGRPGTPMPPWRNLLSEEDVRWIVRYLKDDSHD